MTDDTIITPPQWNAKLPEISPTSSSIDVVEPIARHDDDDDDSPPKRLEEQKQTLIDPNDSEYVPKCFGSRLMKPLLCFFYQSRAEDPTRQENGIPKMREAEWRILLACCFVGVLGMLDWEFFPLALNAIQLDLNITESQVGLVGSAVRLGNVLSFPIASLGDYAFFGGRKTVMMLSTGMFLCLTTLSGLSGAMIPFTTFQFFARGFMTAQTTLSTTLIIESFDARIRGWGIGFFSAVSVLGSAIALILFGFTGDIPGSWRWLYASGIVLFVPLVPLNRYTPESRRFTVRRERLAAESASSRTLGRILPDEVEAEVKQPRAKQHEGHRGLQSKKTNEEEENDARFTGGDDTDGHVSMHEDDDEENETMAERQQRLQGLYLRRLLACTLVSFFNGFSFAPSETLKIKKLQEVHHLDAAGVSAIQISTGLIAFSSFTLAGSLSDRYGRKRFLIIFNTSCALGVFVFFVAPAGSPLVYIANFIQMLAGFVLMTVKSAYFAELFPLSKRATAQGFLVMIEFVAGGISLAIESAMYDALHSHWDACAILSLPAVLSGLVIACFLPESSSKELEHVSPDHLDEASEEEEVRSKSGSLRRNQISSASPPTQLEMI